MRHPSIHRSAAAFAAFVLAASAPLSAAHAKCTRSADECAAHMKEMYQTKGWPGIESEEREDLSILVLSVFPGGPADKAGIKAGDVLMSMNGVTLSRANEEKIAEMRENGLRIGDTVSFGVKRGREINTVKVALERIPDAVLSGLIDRHSREEHQVARN
jgi:C-terminal processing protease CtpA/Prc